MPTTLRTCEEILNDQEQRKVHTSARNRANGLDIEELTRRGLGIVKHVQQVSETLVTYQLNIFIIKNRVAVGELEFTHDLVNHPNEVQEEIDNFLKLFDSTYHGCGIEDVITEPVVNVEIITDEEIVTEIRDEEIVTEIRDEDLKDL